MPGKELNSDRIGRHLPRFSPVGGGPVRDALNARYTISSVSITERIRKPGNLSARSVFSGSWTLVLDDIVLRRGGWTVRIRWLP